MYVLLVDTCWIKFDTKTTTNCLPAQTAANKVDVAEQSCFVKGAVSQGPLYIFVMDLIKVKTIAINFLMFFLVGKKARCNVTYNFYLVCNIIW